jgi:cbb3-type cytochrome oxidase subunit 3
MARLLLIARQAAAILATNGATTRRPIMNIGTYTTYLIVLAIAFIGLVAWVFNKKRKSRWEHDGEIPFEEDKS